MIGAPVGVRGGVERGGGLGLTRLGECEPRGDDALSRVSPRPPPRSTPPLTPTGAPRREWILASFP